MKILLLLSGFVFFSLQTQALPITCPSSTGVGTVTCDCSAGNLAAHGGVCNIKCGSTGGCDSGVMSTGDNSLIITENKKIKLGPISKLKKLTPARKLDNQNEARTKYLINP